MNRGSLPHGILRGLDAPRFNEAPIHESGKCEGEQGLLLQA